jgi:hypothetical protein
MTGGYTVPGATINSSQGTVTPFAQIRNHGIPLQENGEGPLPNRASEVGQKSKINRGEGRKIGRGAAMSDSGQPIVGSLFLKNTHSVLRHSANNCSPACHRFRMTVRAQV